MEHQVAAVVIAVAEHARLARQLAGDRRPLVVERPPLGVGQGNAVDLGTAFEFT